VAKFDPICNRKMEEKKEIDKRGEKEERKQFNN